MAREEEGRKKLVESLSQEGEKEGEEKEEGIEGKEGTGGKGLEELVLEQQLQRVDRMKKQQLTEVLKGAQWNHVGRISQLRERVKGWVRDPDERRWIRRGKDQPWQEDELQRLRLSVASLPPAHSGSLSSLSLSSLLSPPSSLLPLS